MNADLLSAFVDASIVVAMFILAVHKVRR